jgi:ergosteryl-3beta-O-L-aspartate synthase
VTFGAGASTEFKPVHGVDGMRVKMLSKAYADIARRLKLGNKSEFKEKLGAEKDEVYIAYPPDGLGLTGVKAIMDFFQEDDPDAK